jgi:hypothetical protein
MNRFHSKYHRSNHHTNTNSINPDAGHDPIASNDYPFQGDFVVNGNIKNIIYTIDSFSGTTITLPVSSNQLHIKPSGTVTIGTITGGLTGVIYTLTNHSVNSVTLTHNSSPIYVRSSSSLSIGPYGSCNIKYIESNKYSVW